MTELIQEILEDPISSLLIIGNLVLIESLLSVDNAAVLATMVLDLPTAQRKRALKFGILGAYLFRGACLFLATYLVNIWWLKGAGGLYLLYLAIKWIIKKSRNIPEEHRINKKKSKLYSMTVGRVGQFWATVISVEIMDLAFSIDNVFAAVAFSKNILIILAGVFIGILAMRFVAQGFVRLMEHYPFLEAAAYIVIGLLGVKLTASFYEHYYPEGRLTKILESDQADWITSVATMCIFLIPIITSAFFDYPKKK
jgi:YkoY family integral membrane protein